MGPNSLRFLVSDGCLPIMDTRTHRQRPGREPCQFIALHSRASLCPPLWCPSLVPPFAEGSSDGMLRYPFSQGLCLFPLTLHKLPGLRQMCIISRTHTKVGSFTLPKSFSRRRADKGLITCGDKKDTDKEILIQAQGSFFLFYVQIMQHNCFTMINIISGA